MTDGLPTDDFLERPAVNFEPAIVEPFLFPPGRLLGDRFRIVRPLGRGGMGEVYEAEDLELSTHVALKTILPDIANQPAVIERFRAEVLRARSVSHANVCRVYDLFAESTPSGVVRFLTMELLDGETLASRLEREGTIPFKHAPRLIAQMAAALDAAHERGVVHRDFKPGNIMLVGKGPEPRVVVSDFGIAHEWTASGSEDRVAPSERYVGTADYMAPELRATGAVGPSIDLYSFGVVVHELLTGSTPAPPAEAGATRQADSALPRRWRKAIQTCLAPDPLRRPRFAAAVLQQATGETARRRTRAGATIVVALALLALALFEPLSRFLRGVPSIGPNASILVANVENATGEPVLDVIGELLTRQLEQSPRLRILEPAQVTGVLKTMAQPAEAEVTAPRAREVIWRAGASAFVSGRIRKAGSAYALSVRLESRSGEPDVIGRNWSRGYEARDRDELLVRVRDAANWIRSAAGEASPDIPKYDRPVADVTTSSWQALHLYTRAEALLSQSRQDDGLALLSEATREDPDFALAWMRMGDVFMSRRQLDQGYRHWERALEVMRRRNLGTREEYRIRGMFASDTHDYAEAERVYRLYLLNYATDFRPYFYIARPLLMLGRTDEAIAMLQESRKWNASEPSVPAQLAMFKIRAGRLGEVDEELSSLRALGQHGLAECIGAQRAFVAGDYGTALGVFTSLEQSKEAVLRRRAPALEAAVLADLGRTTEAIEQLRHGAESDARRGDVEGHADKLLARAELHLRMGDRRAARDLAVQVEQLDRSSLRMAAVGQVYAQSGALADATRALSTLPKETPSRQLRIQKLRLGAEIVLAQGDARGAWVQFQQAAALEAPGVRPEYVARGAAAAGELGTALAMYRRMAGDPGYYWRYPDHEPGRWFESLTRYLEIGRRMSITPDAHLVERHRVLHTYVLPTDPSQQKETR